LLYVNRIGTLISKAFIDDLPGADGLSLKDRAKYRYKKYGG
jgi:hypothetical protein